MAEADHAAWVKAQRDPALWHQAAMAALAYRGDHHGFLPWLLERTFCGSERFAGQTRFSHAEPKNPL